MIMGNIRNRTSDVQRPSAKRAWLWRLVRQVQFEVECQRPKPRRPKELRMTNDEWSRSRQMKSPLIRHSFAICHSSFVILLFLLLTEPPSARAQISPRFPPGSQLQLQVAQPRVDVTSPVTATAEFDPPVVRPGDKTFYRVGLDATESSIVWPDELVAAPPELKLAPKARGMITQMQPNSFRPLTAFVYEAQPMAAGRYTVPSFSVDVSGARVEIPAASLEVVAANAPRRRSGSLPWNFRRRMSISANPSACACCCLRDPMARSRRSAKWS